MFSPYAFPLVLRHFDAIDQAISEILWDRQTADEEYLTKTLLDYLDVNKPARYRLAYSLEQLGADLRKVHDALGLTFSLKTHRYTKAYENRVSQADLGLIINFQNHFEPVLSRSKAWLLQAKRLFPNSVDPVTFETRSKFSSFDEKQDAEIRRLMKLIGGDFFRYLHYCPRPNGLSSEAQQELSYLRSKNFVGAYFDGTAGLELHNDLRNGSPTVAAGMFVSEPTHSVKYLGDVHRRVFAGSLPFSWFLMQQLPFTRNPIYPLGSLHEGVPISDEVNSVVSAIVEGRPDVVEAICHEKEVDVWDGMRLPASTLTITFSMGQENSNRRPWNDHAYYDDI